MINSQSILKAIRKPKFVYDFSKGYLNNSFKDGLQIRPSE